MDIKTVYITKDMRIRAAEILWPRVRLWLINAELTESQADKHKEEFIKVITNCGVHDDGYSIAKQFDDWSPDFTFAEIVDDYPDLLWDKSHTKEED